MARRRRGRYIGIFRGGKPSEVNRLIQYLKGEIDVNYPARQGNRPPTTKLFVRMFMNILEDGKYLVQKVNAQKWPNVSSYFAGRAIVNGPTAENQVEIPGVLNPRAAVSYNISADAENETSKITGRRYRKYRAQNVVVPFGPANDTESTEEAFRAIKALVMPAGVNNRRVSYIPGTYVD